MTRRTTRATVTGALVVAAGLGLTGAAPASGEHSERPVTRSVTVRDGTGELIARVPLHGKRFAVSYRNSIYGTLAEERYELAPEGRFALVQIAADQLAVLEEYYAVPGAPHRAGGSDRRRWVVAPDPQHPLELGRLSIAATDLGERTLHVPGEPAVRLWRLAGADPTVELDVEGGGR